MRKGWTPILIAAALAAALMARRRAYSAGWDDALAKLSATAPVAQERVRVATGHTDGSAGKVARRAPAVRRAAEALLTQLPLPDTTVRPVLQSCIALANDCEELRGNVLTERAARDSLTQSVQAITIAHQDTLRKLAKRPTRKKAILWGSFAGGLGFILGRR